MTCQGSTVSVSLGGSCEFTYGSHYEDGALQGVTSVLLHSGDVAVFNGQKLPHAVSNVMDVCVLPCADCTVAWPAHRMSPVCTQDKPDWWLTAAVSEDQAALLSAVRRINFQIRDATAIASYGR